MPTLGEIVRLKGGRGRPEMYRLVTLLYPRSPAAEAFRTLRTNLEFASVDAPIKTLLVTSSVPLEGKTVTAANLAVVFAQGGRRVLLVDADLRRPAVERLFALPNQYGLTTLVRGGDAKIESTVQATDQENLFVLSTGPLPPNPAEVLASQRMRAVVRALAEKYDLLLFDSPPLDVFADAAVLSAFMDGTVLVVDASKNRRKIVHQAREALAKANATVLGAVLNRLPEPTYSHYYENYGDYNRRTRRSSDRPVPGRPEGAGSGHRLQALIPAGMAATGITDLTSIRTPPGLRRASMASKPPSRKRLWATARTSASRSARSPSSRSVIPYSWSASAGRVIGSWTSGSMP